MSILGLVTRGYLCDDEGGLPLVELPPEVLSTELRPQIDTEGKEPPKFSVKSVDPAPDASVAEQLSPSFIISKVADQVPDAKPREPSDEPSGKIRPVEDLAPEILKKDDD